MLNLMPHRKMTERYVRLHGKQSRAKTHLQRIVFPQCHAWPKLSAANHSNNVVSALPVFPKSRFGKIVLIILVIATVYTMQIISQSNRLDFLPPDVPLANSGAVLHVAVI